MVKSSANNLFGVIIPYFNIFFNVFYDQNYLLRMLHFFCSIQQIQNFGEPFFLVIHEGETLAEIKERIQKKLQIPDEEFAKVYLTSYIYAMFYSYLCNCSQ